ncbi:MAG: trypsin-like peptidase domain-containing protein [Deltaproteobacteria bacterium]|nr:trypsin-like peptidase domain-containing protein [Deltaproteobacteria bacterium]
MRRLYYVLMVLIFTLTFYTSNSSDALAFPAKEVYQEFGPSVMVIMARGADKGSAMIGAGSLLTASGHIITNAHVILNKKTGRPEPKITVHIMPDEVTGDVTSDLKQYHKAKVVYYSEALDLALLRADSLPHALKIISLANPKEILVGEEVVAIGHPEQGGFWSLTYGRISGQMNNFHGTKGKDVYQTDTSVNRGNSGGPLLDSRGYMVAVNSNIARLSDDGLPITGVNFSIKSSVVRKWLKREGITIAYGSAALTGEVSTKTEKRAPAKTLMAPPITTIKEEPVKEVEVEVEVEDTASESTKKDEPRKSYSRESSEEDDDDSSEDAEPFTTPTRPYDPDEVYAAVEKELEEMVEEMMRDVRKGKKSRESKPAPGGSLFDEM